MNDTQSYNSFRRRIAVIVLILVSCHILVAFAFLLFPARNVPKIINAYKAFTYIGPFFSSRNLVSSYHVVTTVTHLDGTVEHNDLTEQFQSGYISQPWKYHLLSKKIYIRHVTAALGTNLVRGHHVGADSVQRQLHQVAEFLAEEAGLQEGDSVRCGFVWKKYLPSEKRHRADTLFYLPIPLTYGR